MIRRRHFGPLVLVAATLGAGAAVYRLRHTAAGANPVPVATARTGEFLEIVRCRGELTAARSVEIYAPPVRNLRIVWRAPSGAAVKEGEPIVRFDSTGLEQELAQKEAALNEARGALELGKARARMSAQEDETDLEDLRYRVENARLEASKKEIVSRIDGEESRIDLSVADQMLKAQQAAGAQHAAAENSQIAVLTRQLEQAQADVKLKRDQLARLVIRAPHEGIVVFVPNNYQGPANTREFRVGDDVPPGANLAEIPDLSTLEMDGKVEESERNRVAAGDAADLHVDALPELALRSRIRWISPLPEFGVELPPARRFHAYAPIAPADGRLRPGMNGGMDVIVRRIPHAIHIPAKALFTHAGKPVVYVARGHGYQRVEVRVEARNPDDVAVSGISGGVLVALADPEHAEAAP